MGVKWDVILNSHNNVELFKTGFFEKYAAIAFIPFNPDNYVIIANYRVPKNIRDNAIVKEFFSKVYSIIFKEKT